MRVMITGGGTGGHLYPALAVAGLLQEKDPDGKILFVGTREGLEGTVVPDRGYRFQPVSAVKWPRQISAQVLAFPVSLAQGYYQSLKIIKEWRPQVVFATGGYVSVPLVLAAARQRVPIFLHEQNVVPGMANKLLARWAHTVFLTFPARPGLLSGKLNVIHAGLPIRQQILSVSRFAGREYFQLEPNIPTVLVTGGSRGARRINEVMLEVYQMLADVTKRPPIQFIHLTGRAVFPAFCKQMEEKGINEDIIGKIVIRPYLEEMEYALAAADLMICRAGAATLAELTALGIPAILIPYPYAAGNHQYHNALLLAREKAAVLLPEAELTAGCLLSQLQQLIDDDAQRTAMGQAARRLGRPQAGEIIARAILKAGGNSRTYRRDQ